MELDTIFGPFFGAALTHPECEILAIAKIDAKILTAEPALYGTKWFDYRPLHPTLATYLLAHYYNRAYGDFMGQCFSHKKRFMAAFKGKDVMAAREVKSFWKLRQRIDTLGMRYDFFCRHAMAWCGENGWKQPPRPAHVASNDDLIVYVMNRWQEECNAKIQWACHPRYLAAAWHGAPDQQAYEQHLLAAIAKRAHPKYALHAALYLHGALRVEAALEHLSEAALRDAMQLCTANGVSHN